MKIGIAGHIATGSIAPFLDGDGAGLPRGYYGAPLLGTLIGALLERGHSIVAYTTSSDMPAGTRVSASGSRFKITYCAARPRAFRYSEGHWGRAADGFKRERVLLRQAMQHDAPDLVHAHWSYEFALAAIESGLPHLVTCHDAPQVVLRYSPDPYRLVRYFMARRVLSQARNLTAVSPYLQRALQRYARSAIAVVPNPLPVHTGKPAAPANPLQSPWPCIAMVLNGWGALKNPHPALRAFAVLRQTFPGAALRIMGSDFGAEGKAAAWARTRGLQHGVHFLGPQPYSALLATLAESDLLLHPALEETFGMAIAEAMSLGVPVIGGQYSGAVPWVIGEGGIVTDVRSPDAIHTALVDLFSNPAQHQRFSRAARLRAEENFGAAHVAEAYETQYLTALSKRNHSCPVEAHPPLPEIGKN